MEDYTIEEILSNLILLGLSEDLRIGYVSGLDFEDIKAAYIRNMRDLGGSKIFIENADRKREIEKAYRYFVNLFEETGAYSLKDLIPEEYRADPLEDLGNLLLKFRKFNREIVPKLVENYAVRRSRKIDKILENRKENYEKFEIKKYELKNKMKELKKKAKKLKKLKLTKRV